MLILLMPLNIQALEFASRDLNVYVNNRPAPRGKKECTYFTPEILQLRWTGPSGYVKNFRLFITINNKTQDILKNSEERYNIKATAGDLITFTVIALGSKDIGVPVTSGTICVLDKILSDPGKPIQIISTSSLTGKSDGLRNR